MPSGQTIQCRMRVAEKIWNSIPRKDWKTRFIIRGLAEWHSLNAALDALAGRTGRARRYLPSRLRSTVWRWASMACLAPSGSRWISASTIAWCSWQ